jgi:hypothetical protein
MLFDAPSITLFTFAGLYSNGVIKNRLYLMSDKGMGGRASTGIMSRCWTPDHVTSPVSSKITGCATPVEFEYGAGAEMHKVCSKGCMPIMTVRFK